MVKFESSTEWPPFPWIATFICFVPFCFVYAHFLKAVTPLPLFLLSELPRDEPRFHITLKGLEFDRR
ncbi:hypothetical protein SLE2022_103330 [Rubroshorea leprosula]